MELMWLTRNLTFCIRLLFRYFFFFFTPSNFGGLLWIFNNICLSFPAGCFWFSIIWYYYCPYRLENTKGDRYHSGYFRLNLKGNNILNYFIIISLIFHYIKIKCLFGLLVMKIERNFQFVLKHFNLLSEWFLINIILSRKQLCYRYIF